MITNKALGIVFANVNDNLVSELTKVRSIASVPFGARYRLVDFALSNLVNAGINKVGVITRENYRSLMDHLGSGKPWDLDRKNNGLFILPPYSTVNSGVYRGYVDALSGVMTFLTRSNEELVVLCDGNIVGNIDVSAMIKKHIETCADVTIAYKNGKPPKSANDTMLLSFDENDTVTDITFNEEVSGKMDFGLAVLVVTRQKLIELITEADKNRYINFATEVLKPSLHSLKIVGYKQQGFCEVIDSNETYVTVSKKLLDKNVRKELFNKERPIYTKTRDDMPTRYGINAKVENSLVADGCVIEGTVKNSVLFRGAQVGAGAVVEDCIVMQGGKIEKGAKLQWVTMDKNCTVGEEFELRGTARKNIFVSKDKTV